MNNNPTRARVEVTSMSIGDPQEQRPCLTLSVPNVGDVRCHHASLAFAGYELVDGDRRAIALIVGRPPCDCGCGIPGQAFTVFPSPDVARAIGQKLLNLADEQESLVAEAARLALDKAGRP